jgi:hypothetical protein
MPIRQLQPILIAVCASLSLFHTAYIAVAVAQEFGLPHCARFPLGFFLAAAVDSADSLTRNSVLAQ